MALNIRLIVHGVPKGQDLWGVNRDERSFIENFYTEWDVPEQMRVEVRKVAGETLCYYTFIRGGKVVDCSGRPGGYFALTLVFNQYYRDLQNIYNILHTTYHKCCVGTIVNDDGKTCSFRVSDFRSIDKQLQDMQLNALNYISLYSNNQDILALNNYPCNAGAGCQMNISECTASTADSNLRKGFVCVSHLFPTTEIKTIQAGHIEEIRRMQSQHESQMQGLRQETSRMEQQLREQIHKTEEEARNQLDQERRRSEQSINDVRREYKDVDSKVRGLDQKCKNTEKELKEAKEKRQKAEESCTAKDNEIQRLQQQITQMTEQGHSLPPNTDIPFIRKKIKLKPEASAIAFIVIAIIVIVGLVCWVTCKQEKATTEAPRLELKYTSPELRKIVEDVIRANAESQKKISSQADTASYINA